MKENKIYPWIVVGLLWFVALLNYLDRQMLSTMKPSMMIDIAELTKAENFGRLMAIFLWIYAFMSPVSGIIADRLNRKWLIVGSLFVWSGVTLTMGYATTFNQLYVLRAIMGVSEAFYIPAGLSLIVDYHQGKTRSIAVGIHTTGIYLGQAFGGFGATIASNFSWQWTFHFFGLIGVAYSLVLILFLKEKKTYTIDHTQKSSIRKEFSQAYKGLGVLFGNIAFWVLLFYFSAPSFPGWAVKNWLPTLFSDALHMDMSQAGPLATITTAMSSFVGVLLGGFISDRWVQKNMKGRIFTGVVGLLFTIPALFLLGYGSGFEFILLGGVFFGLGFGMFDVNNMPILCQFVSPRYRATGYGLMNLAGISAGAVITSFLGKSADAGNMRQDFAMLSIIVLVAIVLQLTILKPTTINKTEDTCSSKA
ncbi:MAG: MFS transporter [Bacteroidetes bacterium GWF2_42_66]|nr:MAG: MFS transporter [Bacteroidetes bacterium GWA2_42_15]OFY00384.1 MAG: MFS transporter [Bacteroidetes bacterium GWE2_42_39]OFY47046.1 MAG: MFS transporter [Bacteroidetes bacterium GWF2_42_66]HAZ04314.1 MFS transporter [Marinilabiliales bacterium]HBL76792.1 MFS transporter [Prolixibacteraceae bacterium]